MLRDEMGDLPLRIVELEELGLEGKRLRAACALATGRTSMPNIFVGGRSIGGFTDGFADGGAALPDGALAVAEAPAARWSFSKPRSTCGGL